MPTVSKMDSIIQTTCKTCGQLTNNASQSANATAVQAIDKSKVTVAESIIDAVKEATEQIAKVKLDEKNSKSPGRGTVVGRPMSLAEHKALRKKPQKINWLFFDCDNTLVLSETLAFTASFGLVNEVLASKGIDHEYVEDEILVHFMGLSFKGMCEKMSRDFKFEWTEDDKKHFAAREEEEVIKIFEKKLTPMRGIFNVLVQIVFNRSHNIAVVSSSSTKRIMACLKKTKLDMFFLPQYIFSAADSLSVPATKPDPAIYLHAMKELGVKPEQCVCIEDSRVGVKAAVDAGVPCIGFLQSYNGRSKQDQLVIDFEKDGVTEIMWEWKDFFDVLEKIENK